MKANRIITGLTASVMSVAMLTSCSEAELKYLDFTKEIAGWKVLTGTGEMVVELNKETLADFIKEFSETSEDYSISASDIPFEKLSLVYDVSADYNNNAYHIDFDITVDDNKPYAVNFYVDTEKIVFEKSVLDSVERFLDDYNLKDSYISCRLEFLDEYFKDYDSIEIPYEESMDMSLNNAGLSMELTDVMSDFMITAFDGYETSSYELNGANGVKAVFNYDNVVKAISDLFEYYINNTDKINSAWNEFSDDILNIAEKIYPDEVYYDDMSENFKLPTVDEAQEIQAQFNSLINDKSFNPIRDLLMNTEYGFDIERVNDTSYKSNSYIDLNYKGSDLGKITAIEASEKLEQLEIKEYNSYVINHENDVTFNEDFDKWLDENHPVQSVNINWDKGENHCVVSFTRDNDYMDVEPSELINIDDCIYVPMREFVEGMGYSLEWNAENSKAYVVNGDEKFDMTTTMVGDITFIKVRDFENMGLYVNYTEDDNGMGIIRCTAIVDK